MEIAAQKSNNYIFPLIILLFTFQSCNSLLQLPFFGSKLQPFEILSLLITVIAVVQFIPFKMYFRWTVLDIALASHAFAVILSVMIHYNPAAFLEGLGSVYLFIFYFIFSRLLLAVHITENINVLKKGYLWSLILCIAGAWFGLLIYYLFQNSSYLTIYDHYPYFGNIWRLTGFSSSSNVLVSNMCTALLMLLVFGKKMHPFFLFVIILTILLTLSKELFIYTCGGLLFFFYIREKIKLRTAIVAFAGVAILYCSLVYFTYGSQNNKLVVAETPVQVANVKVYPTTYFYLARSGVEISSAYFPWGCGKGNFINVVSDEQLNGNYPPAMIVNEPHDAYIGLFAECGVVGLISVFLIFIAICLQYRVLKRSGFESRLVTGIFFLFICWSIESLALGTVQFRHYWIVFALFNTIYLDERFTGKTLT